MSTSPPAATCANRSLDDDSARHALAHAADELFYRRGIVDVSMAEIRDVSGVSLRRLYSLCPSKSDLVAVWLRARHITWMDRFTAAVDSGIRRGSEPVDAIFDALHEWMIDTNFRGCGFINTHAESSGLTEQHRQIIRDHKRAVATYLGTITGHGSAIAVLVDGAIVQAAIFGSTAPIDLARCTATSLTRTEDSP